MVCPVCNSDRVIDVGDKQSEYRVCLCRECQTTWVESRHADIAVHLASGLGETNGHSPEL